MLNGWFSHTQVSYSKWLKTFHDIGLLIQYCPRLSSGWGSISIPPENIIVSVFWDPTSKREELYVSLLSDSFWCSIEGLDSLLISCCSMGLCVKGSKPRSFNFFLILVFQWFLISLSVLPGKCAAILDHLNENEVGWSYILLLLLMLLF